MTASPKPVSTLIAVCVCVGGGGGEGGLEELGGWGLLLTKEVFHSSREVRTRFENVQFAKKILNTHFVPDCCRSPNHYATLDQDMPFYTQTWTCAWPSYQRYKNGFYCI